VNSENLCHLGAQQPRAKPEGGVIRLLGRGTGPEGKGGSYFKCKDWRDQRPYRGRKRITCIMERETGGTGSSSESLLDLRAAIGYSSERLDARHPEKFRARFGVEVRSTKRRGENRESSGKFFDRGLGRGRAVAMGGW